MSATQEGLWVFAPDLHAPKVHRPTWNALMDFLDHNPVRGFIFGGDQLDNAEISHHNHGKIIFREPGLYKRNTDIVDACVKEVEARIHEDAARVWIKGNHDDWERQLIESNPEMQGSVERDKLLGLAARGWQVVEAGKEFELGKLCVIHGETLSGSNHAQKAVGVYGCSVLYGHFHGPQSFTRVAPVRKKSKHAAYCSPILGDTNPHYLRNKPTNWVNGFTIIEVSARGHFNVYPAITTDGRFRYGGVGYGG